MVSEIILNYRQLLEEYDLALVEQLRGLELGQDFLANWVPDSNTLRSVINLIDVVHLAGRTTISIQFGDGQLTPNDKIILLESLGDCMSAEFEKNSDGIILRINGIAAPHWDVLNHIVDSKKLRKAAPLEQSGTNQVSTQVSTESYFKVKLFERSINFEGELQLDPGSIFVVSLDGVKLFFKITGNIPSIEKARHAGAKEDQDKAYWDFLCENLQGSPLIEGVEHGVLKMVHKLAELGAIQRGPGIFLPSNAGKLFVSMQNVVLKLYSNYCSENKFKSSLNEFDPPPRIGWTALSYDERTKVVQQSMEKFTSSETDDKVTLSFERIESDLDGYPVRVFVGFSNVNSIDKSNIARELERYLKINLEPKLQIYTTEVKDKNKIRRLR